MVNRLGQLAKIGIASTLMFTIFSSAALVQAAPPPPPPPGHQRWEQRDNRCHGYYMAQRNYRHRGPYMERHRGGYWDDRDQSDNLALTLAVITAAVVIANNA